MRQPLRFLGVQRQRARECSSLQQANLQQTSSKFAVSTLLAQAFFTLQLDAKKDLRPFSPLDPIPMQVWEMDTPLHVPSTSTLHDRQSFGTRSSVKDAVRTTGVAVVGPILTNEAVQRLRGAIVRHQKFIDAAAATPPQTRSRYLDPLCAFEADECRAWDMVF